MAKPISVEPSHEWEGNDGPWSTFAIQVGNPPQPLRVLASTTVPETWVVLAIGFNSNDSSTRPNTRGNLFNKSQSTTWHEEELSVLDVEVNLFHVDNYDKGLYGFDTITLGYNGSGGPSLDHQVIAGIGTSDFWLGSLGLAPWQHDISSPETNSGIDTSPGYLSNLKNRSLIPSLSFGYSAGAPYRLNKVDGTLTLGGYDSSRFTPNGISFPFNSDRSRNLEVGLQSIEFSDSNTEAKELLSEYILIFVDSTVPHIWLPVSACKEFENVFGITHDPHSDFYLVNDTQHETLLGQNATVTFVIGNNFVGGDKVNITFPYLSFDLEAGDSPLDEGRSRYFPLRRAVNVTQYTLGRAFLQESYLIVDFERSNFSLSQATFVENAEQKLVPILSKDDTSLNITEISPGPPRSTHKLSSAAVAGIVVAIVLGLLIGATVFIISRWRARNAQKIRREEPEGFSGKPELDGEGKPFIAQPQRAEIERTHGGIEMEGSSGWVKIDGRNAAVELEAPVPRPVELPSSDPGDSVIPSLRILLHKPPPSNAAEKENFQSSSPKYPQPTPPWSPSSLLPSSRLRLNQPATSLGAETGNLEQPKNPESKHPEGPEGSKRRWFSSGRRWKSNNEVN